jgi:hypothetical protein
MFGFECATQIRMKGWDVRETVSLCYSLSLVGPGILSFVLSRMPNPGRSRVNAGRWAI